MPFGPQRQIFGPISCRFRPIGVVTERPAGVRRPTVVTTAVPRLLGPALGPARGPALGLAVGLALVLAGCSTDVLSEPDPSPAAGSQPAPTYSTPSGGAGAASGASFASVDVELGHCFVVPVRFDGELWNVPFADQFGWGGLEPDGWTGHGVMTRPARDRAEFVDNLGAVVEFRPVDDPSVVEVESAGCD